MASNSLRWQITKRDIDILTALDLSPFTPEQILRMSAIWSQPFTSLRRAQERLHDLAAAGQLRSWRYATIAQGGSSQYYKLTLQGYRTLHGPDATPPTKRYFQSLGVARHHHTYCLSQFIVHAFLSAAYRGLNVTDTHAENTFAVTAGDRKQYPDWTFTLVTPCGRTYPFMYEQDNATEPIRSDRDVESIERKMRLYLQHQQATGERYRVIIATTGNNQRIANIIDLANRLTSHLSFQPFYVASHGAFLSESDAFFVPCFGTPQNPKTPLLQAAGRFASRRAHSLALV